MKYPGTPTNPTDIVTKSYVDTAIEGVEGGGAPAWEDVTGTPTTIAGYGITDAVELPIAESDVTNLTTDLAAKANKAQRVAVTYSATPDFDLSLGSVFDITLTGAASYTFSNPTDGQKIIIRWRQDGTGSRVITHPANVRFGTDLTTAVLGTTANKTDYIGYVYNAQDNKYDLVSFAKGY